MYPTPYLYVNEVLEGLLSGARAQLGDQFHGLYLYGSLAAGDFNPDRSDIDFIVVTIGELSEKTIGKLEELHGRFASSDEKWARKLEGLYMPLDALRRYDPGGPALPTVNEGHFYLAKQGSDWVIQRHILRENETIVAGPSIRGAIDPVSAAEMRDAVSGIMRDWWAPMLDDPSWLDRPEYRAFTVQTMCRVLYTLQFGTAVSKSGAANWAMETLDPEWRALISDAIAWPERKAASIEETLQFVKFSVDSCD